jgi:hypothetical protein
MYNEYEKNKEAILKRVAESLEYDTTIEISRVFNFGHQYNFAFFQEKLRTVKNLNADQ